MDNIIIHISFFYEIYLKIIPNISAGIMNSDVNMSSFINHDMIKSGSRSRFTSRRINVSMHLSFVYKDSFLLYMQATCNKTLAIYAL